MADFLLELFSEEIPARMQASAVGELSAALGKELSAIGLECFNSTRLHHPVTPRRLAAILTDIKTIQPNVVIERKGPRVDAPQAAIEGFVKSTGLTFDQLENRNGIYFATIEQKGRPTADLLKDIVEKVLSNFYWPKSMRWGDSSIRWVRPLHNILCIFDGKIVPVQFGSLTANNYTYGHRFLAPKAIKVNNPADYEALLKDASVRVDMLKRHDAIQQQIGKLATQIGGTVIADAALLEEVTGLVEWPIALMGNIDAEYMELPEEVLVTVMRSHQKYFALRDAAGKLAPYFITIANRVGHDGGKVIIAGNERVLRARFADGRFFWEQDRKRSLDEWSQGLASVTYHAKLGSIAEKVERVTALALQLAEHVPGADKALVARAARLAKADLVTGMVGEFPELQGIMGRYYALAQGETAAVANAIRDHYKPQGPNDSLPSEPTAICVALADKLDTLNGLFSIGEKPTGSKDPFALRRAALGVIRIILEHRIRLPIHDILREFFIDRLKVMLKEIDIRHDVINAVTHHDNDLWRISRKAQDVQALLSHENGTNLLAAYKRAANILAIEQKKDGQNYNYADLNRGLLKEPAEQALVTALDTHASAIALHLQREEFDTACQQLALLRGPVDQFFDHILVNAPEPELRANRLHILAAIKDNIDKVADFGKIEG